MHFTREMACTERELLGWLPGAVGAHALALGDGSADVTLGRGRLRLRWQALPPRRIASITLPRLSVRFAFEGVDADEQRRFMRYFDLYMQRGGG